MNDPDQTMGLPVVELSSEPNGSSAYRTQPPADTIVPPKGAAKASASAGAGADPYKFEPTVFGAIRRYRVMVIAVAILGMLAAIAYTMLQPTVYQAGANVTVPLPSSSSATADPGQYLDSQVLLLQSPGVAQQAASIANSRLGASTLSASDFSGSGSSLAVNPPTTATPGAYGASIVAVSFKGPNAEVAQVGLDSVLQAFVQADSNAIRQQADATIAGINAAIKQTTSEAQRATLQAQATQTLVNEQTDLARTPTAAFEPTTKASGHMAVNAVIGLVAGLVVGAALAYARAVRRRAISGPQDVSAIYGVPMIAETPAVPATDGVPPIVANPRSEVAEAFRFAASSLERVCAARGLPLALAFVSPRAGRGKHTMVASLALAMAERGSRVLVVDADPAGGVAAQLLPGVTVSHGLEEVLSGQLTLAACILPSPLNDAVTVLGPAPAAARPVAGPARARAMRGVLAAAKPGFDVVIVDAPALLEVADAAEVADTADAAIIVVGSDDRIPDHLDVVTWLRSTTAQVLGYMYNRAQPRSAGRRQGPVARLVSEGHHLLDNRRLVSIRTEDEPREPLQQSPR